MSTQTGPKGLDDDTGAQNDSDAVNVDDDVIDANIDSGAPVDNSGTEGDVSDVNDDAPQDASEREKRYRLQARAAETERDRLAGVVEGLQRAAVEKLIEDDYENNRGPLRSKAFWLSGVEVADLIDADTGLVDTEKVTGAIKEAVEMFGLGVRPYVDSAQGNGSGEGAQEQEPTLADAFRPR